MGSGTSSSSWKNICITKILIKQSTLLHNDKISDFTSQDTCICNEDDIISYLLSVDSVSLSSIRSQPLSQLLQLLHICRSLCQSVLGSKGVSVFYSLVNSLLELLLPSGQVIGRLGLYSEVGIRINCWRMVE